jgi:hypothetical protein
VLDLLKETGKLGAKPANVPMKHSQKWISDNEPLEDADMFQRLIGKLIYLTITKPDISYTVSYLSQFMHKPMKGHFELVNQVLRYLKVASGRGILMKNHGHVDLIGYSDADYAGSPRDRKSTSGFYMFVGENLITWKNKKQAVVARSSVKAEYRVVANATSEIIWLKILLRELGHNLDDAPTKLFCDNQAAIHIFTNPVFHEMTKHIEMDCHFIREKILNKIIETPYICSSDQVANIFTKALSRGIFDSQIHSKKHWVDTIYLIQLISLENKSKSELVLMKNRYRRNYKWHIKIMKNPNNRKS